MLHLCRAQWRRAAGISTLIFFPMMGVVSCCQVYRSLRPLKPEFIISAATMEGDSTLRVTAGARMLRKVNLILNPTPKEEGFCYFAEMIPPAQSLIVSLHSFAQPNGRKFSPLSHHANTLKITAEVGRSHREWTGVLRHEWDHQYRKVAMAGEEPPDMLGIAYGLAGLAVTSWLFGGASLGWLIYKFSRGLRRQSQQENMPAFGSTPLHASP